MTVGKAVSTEVLAGLEDDDEDDEDSSMESEAIVAALPGATGAMLGAVGSFFLIMSL